MPAVRRGHFFDPWPGVSCSCTSVWASSVTTVLLFVQVLPYTCDTFNLFDNTVLRSQKPAAVGIAKVKSLKIEIIRGNNFHLTLL